MFIFLFREFGAHYETNMTNEIEISKLSVVAMQLSQILSTLLSF